MQNRLNGKSTVSAEQTEWDKHSQGRMDSTGKAQSVQNGFNRKSTVSAEWIQQEKHSQCRMDSMEKVQSVQNGFSGKSTVRHALTSLPVTSSN